MLPSNPGVEFIILCQCVIVSLAVKVFITSLVGLCFSVSGTEMFVDLLSFLLFAYFTSTISLTFINSLGIVIVSAPIVY